MTQQSLFPESDLPKHPAYDPQDVRDKLQAFLGKMRPAASWPWRGSTVSHYRERVWPSLLRKLPRSEAERLRAEFEAEAQRLNPAE